jgi:hypothetical protein
MKKNSPLLLFILFFLAFSLKGMTQPSSLLTGIVSYWTLDETTGNAIDKAGGGNNGTPTNVTQHITGKINTAYGFTGTNSYIDMGNKANLSLTTSGSVSAWIYPTDVTHMGMIVSKGNPGSDLNGYNLGFLYNTLYWELANTTFHIQGSYPIAGHIVNNTWYLVTLTWDGSNVNLYLNGTAVTAPVTQTVTPVSDVYPFRIGARGDYLVSSLFQGTIDEAGVWNRGLTAAEVASLYSAGTGNQYPFNGGGQNIPPVAIAGPDQTLSNGNSATKLNGSGTDADGVVVGYAWTLLPGVPEGTIISSPNFATTTVSGLSPGNTYTFMLTVTDNLGATGTSTVMVTVNSSSGGPSWSTTGNSGTVDGTNFLGTTDSVPLSFRVNNLAAGRIDPGLQNTFYGYQSGGSNTGFFNAANTANGYKALFSNTRGANNTANGDRALYLNTTGGNNTANGDEALFHNTTGDYNTANGAQALFNNTTGYDNTANGGLALFYNTTGYYNTANGFQALNSNTIGTNNTANGYQALYSNTTGYDNIANGSGALVSNTTGYDNTANGYQALFSNTTGYDNTANGYKALYSNTGGILGGNSNTANGTYALFNNTTGSYNTANGSEALIANTTGHQNTANGYQALYFNTTGFWNTANGEGALILNTTGNSNTANGSNALPGNTTGYSNTAVGYNALIYNTTGSFLTAIGSYAKVNADGFTNSTALGNEATITKSNQVVLGNSSITEIAAQVTGITALSDSRFKKNIKEDVPGLEFINLLRPVTYNYDIKSFNTQIKGNPPVAAPEKNTVGSGSGKTLAKIEALQPTKEDEAGIAQKEKINYTGLVAQEVEKAANKVGYDFSGLHKPQNDKDTYGLNYTDFVVPLIKSVQELSSSNDNLGNKVNSMNSSLQNEIDNLKNQNNELQNRLNQLELKLESLVKGGISSSGSTMLSSAKLEQNIPNPFNQTTLINYYVPETAGHAFIKVTGVNGNAIKTIQLNGTGSGQVTLQTATLASGNYTYSLYVDGNLIDTKVMALAR